MDEFDDELEGEALPSRRFVGVDLLVVGLGFASDIATDVGSALTQLRNLTAMHANYRVDQRSFAEEAAKEIETLTSGETDG